MRNFVYKTEIECPVSALFDWHLRERAFERLTPPWLDVHVKGMPKPLELGLKIDMSVRKFGVPLDCRFAVTELETDKKFVDEQLKGPFAYWRHEHKFEALDGDRSLMHDDIRFTLPLGFVSDRLMGPFMERDLQRLFQYRHEVLKRDLSNFMRNRLRPRQKCSVLSPQSKLFEPLASYLATQGHAVHAHPLDSEQTQGDDTTTLINLCDQASDMRTTESLISDYLTGNSRLKVYIEVHDAYAGDNSNENFNRRCERLLEASVRCIYVRTGAILSAGFGVLRNNRDWRSETQPWIAVDDLVSAIEFCMLDETISGQIHMTANQKKPPTNEFKTLFDMQYPFRYPTLKAARAHVLE